MGTVTKEMVEATETPKPRFCFNLAWPIEILISAAIVLSAGVIANSDRASLIAAVVLLIIAFASGYFFGRAAFAREMLLGPDHSSQAR